MTEPTQHAEYVAPPGGAAGQEDAALRRGGGDPAPPGPPCYEGFGFVEVPLKISTELAAVPRHVKGRSAVVHVSPVSENQIDSTSGSPVSFRVTVPKWLNPSGRRRSEPTLEQV